MGRNFSIASKKHQNDFDVLVIVRKRLKNGIAISFFELSTVAPKPRAEGCGSPVETSEYRRYSEALTEPAGETKSFCPCHLKCSKKIFSLKSPILSGFFGILTLIFQCHFL